MTYTKKITHLFWVTFVVAACSPPPPPALTFQDREQVDSLFSVEYDKMKDTLEILCTQIKSKTIQPAIDSLLLVRLKEIAKQKSRYQQ